MGSVKENLEIADIFIFKTGDARISRPTTDRLNGKFHRFSDPTVVIYLFFFDFRIGTVEFIKDG